MRVRTLLAGGTSTTSEQAKRGKRPLLGSCSLRYHSERRPKGGHRPSAPRRIHTLALQRGRGRSQCRPAATGNERMEAPCPRAGSTDQGTPPSGWTQRGEPESNDPEFPPSPYTGRPPHPPSRDTRCDRPPFLTSVERDPRPYVVLEKRDGLSTGSRPGGSRTLVDQPLLDDAQEKPPLSRHR